MSLFYVVLLVIERTLNVDDIQIFDVYFTGMQFFFISLHCYINRTVRSNFYCYNLHKVYCFLTQCAR